MPKQTITLLYGANVDKYQVISVIKSVIYSGNKSQIQLSLIPNGATLDCQSFSQGGDWFHLTFGDDEHIYHYDAFNGWHTENILEPDDDGSAEFPAVEPYVRYSLDESGMVVSAKLYGFTSIPAGMFYEYRALASIDISDSPNLTSIGTQAFYNCKALNSIEITATTVEPRAFQGSGLKKVWIRSSCETINATAANQSPFVGCSLTRIYAEPSSKPDGWSVYFNRYYTNGNYPAPVTYNQTTSPF